MPGGLRAIADVGRIKPIDARLIEVSPTSSSSAAEYQEMFDVWVFPTGHGTVL